MPSTQINRLLQPGPVTQIRFDITSRCNLRCVYCAVSHPGYRGEDMSELLARKVVELILILAKHQFLDPIDLNGHGETAHRHRWTEICFALLEHGVPVRLTSNFSKAFDEHELEALACMQEIAISIDAADRELLQSIRRRVDVRQILANIASVRGAALRLRRKPPNFTFLCGLYDKSAVCWDDFARFAIVTGVAHVAVWSLTEHPDLAVSAEERVRPLDDLPDHELRPRLQIVSRGMEPLRRHGIDVTIQGDFVAALAHRVGLDA